MAGALGTPQAPVVAVAWQGQDVPGHRCRQGGLSTQPLLPPAPSLPRGDAEALSPLWGPWNNSSALRLRTTALPLISL